MFENSQELLMGNALKVSNGLGIFNAAFGVQTWPAAKRYRGWQPHKNNLRM
jgi:hypothetical protein